MADYDLGPGPVYYYGNVATDFTNADGLPQLDVFDILILLDVITDEDGKYAVIDSAPKQWLDIVPVEFRRLCNIKNSSCNWTRYTISYCFGYYRIIRVDTREGRINSGEKI